MATESIILTKEGYKKLEEELEILAAEKELSELDAQFDGDTILDAALAESMQIQDGDGETLDVDTDDLLLDDADLGDDLLDIKRNDLHPNYFLERIG